MKWTFFFTLILFGAAGCGKPEPPKTPPPPTVTVASPTRKSVTVYGEYPGQVDSPQTVELRARVEGFLKEIHFQEGQDVEQSALMFVIDPDQYQVDLQKAKAQLMTAEAALTQAKNVKDIEVDQAHLAQAEAELVNARQSLEDMKTAMAANALPRSQLDSAVMREREAVAGVEGGKATLAQAQADFPTRVAQAEANVATARAAVAAAQLSLDYTRIYSPLKGRVGLAYNKIGALVGHGEPTLLATVSAVDPVYVTFSISEREAFNLNKLAGDKPQGRLLNGQPVKMLLEDGQEYEFAGRINFIDRALDASTGTLILRAEFPNPGRFLRPGNYAKIRMVLAEKPDALMVSERALGADQGGPFVLVVDSQNVVEQRPVKLGPKMDGLAALEPFNEATRTGLKPDELIVVKGLQRARPGNTVSPVREDAPIVQSPKSKAPGQ
jgi:RND family efflux transporter MFP subunit